MCFSSNSTHTPPLVLSQRHAHTERGTPKSRKRHVPALTILINNQMECRRSRPLPQKLIHIAILARLDLPDAAACTNAWNIIAGTHVAHALLSRTCIT